MNSTTPEIHRKRDFIILFATLFLFWLLLSNSLAVDVLIIGVVVSAFISLVFYQGLTFFTEFRLSPQAVVAGFKFYGHFFKELLRSNLSMAAIVLSPPLPISPAIVKVRTRLKSRMGRLMLANSITLTPGTMTVAMEGEWLYIHCVRLDDSDLEAATREIVSEFEPYLEVMYG
ncbi:MAG: Na+/H+ antiporter subunit E [Gammaproteobacteria bacterium]|nr:Na+/H+ antiporter subunit E [Gammaproteobacteria bacterium]